MTLVELEKLYEEKSLATQLWQACLQRNVAGMDIAKRVQADLAAEQAYQRMVTADGKYRAALRETIDQKNGNP